MTCLGIVVLATVVLYYQFYLIGAVSTRVLAEFHISFTAYGAIIIGAAVACAVASLLAGIADRYGRANIITIGLAIVGLLCLAGIPHVHSKTSFAILWMAIGFVEGVILTATPAMIRGFRPRSGGLRDGILDARAGTGQPHGEPAGQPGQQRHAVAGPLHDRRGGRGAAPALSAVFLRELAPALRDQRWSAAATARCSRPGPRALTSRRRSAGRSGR